ncbi:MAG: PSD1 and planctomycete cytochrome C domain-containing protein [Acidobacteriota bacterium]|nr:PSD1 and planctomycete cytochrome C domain-containing protein [Acidobacteriota bacterium]
MIKRGLALAVIAAACGLVHASEPAPRFDSQVRPLLNRYCLQCHGESLQMGDLDLRTVYSMEKGGSQGPALVKGNAGGSLLYQRVADHSMPQGEEKLEPEEVRLLADWINAGAPWDPLPEQPDLEPAAAHLPSHWSFRPIRKPPVPSVRNRDWVRTPVDAFILSRLEEKGIQPAALADSRTLIRRLTLVLTGLPPSLEESDRLTLGPGDPAHTRLVDELLGAPQYGERWARHWLDVVRYAESNGYERDGTKPHAWRYRDYVIDAFNRDKPYDRFLTEQLAGDEIDGTDAETQIATTFLRLGTWDDEPAEERLDRYEQLDDVLGTASSTFLGLTLRCARCHDHKFEPFSQEDYYRSLAFFEPLKRPKNLLKPRVDLDRMVGTPEELERYRVASMNLRIQMEDLQAEKKKLSRKILNRLLSGGDSDRDLSWAHHAETVLAFRTREEDRTDEQKSLVRKFEERMDREILAEATTEEAGNLSRWEREMARAKAKTPAEPPRAYVWYEDTPYPAATRILLRGDPGTPGEEVHPLVPTILGRPDLLSRLGPVEPTVDTSGRRRWLARWMSHPENPLVARVMVNRIWQWVFGDGLVATENDFGVAGDTPSHPRLLDWLASEFIDSGWSVKHLVRLLVGSSTFAQSSDWNPQAAGADHQNRLLWRWQPRRLEAEAVRDSMLAVSGSLNHFMHGPSMFPRIPDSVLAGQSMPGLNWGDPDPEQNRRRSIYIFVKRSLAVPELDLLDSPDTTSSCEQRRVSTTGPQALTFLNGDFAHEQARRLAQRVMRTAGDERDNQVRGAFRMGLARGPSPEELEAALDFLRVQEAQIRDDLTGTETTPAIKARALQSFCLTLLNTNEFFYLN